MEQTQPVFIPLNTDNADLTVNEIESLCVNCEKNGVTRLLFTKIPHYKDIVIMSFLCDFCGYHNNEVQSCGIIAEQGLRIILKVETPLDLNRQIIKSEYSSVAIPEVELEIPYRSRPSEITNVEGIIQQVMDSLLREQPIRTEQHPEQAEKISQFLDRLKNLLNLSATNSLILNTPFTLIIDDPSGNCFIESRHPGQVDHQLQTIHYHRSLELNKMLGLVADDSEEDDASSGGEKLAIWESKDSLRNEVLQFGVNCPNCNAPAVTNMKMVDIPNFQDVVVMATNCDVCGQRTNEVKSGGGIKDKGQRISLHIEKLEDLTRDLLKSETCGITIPEIDMDVGMGALGGRYTTVEGLIKAIHDQLANGQNFCFGDSALSTQQAEMKDFLTKLNDIMEMKLPVTLVLDDPAGNSYIQNLAGATDDNRLTIISYERNWDQNEALGLNDMKTENY